MAKKKAIPSLKEDFRTREKIVADEIQHFEQLLLERSEPFPKITVSAEECLQHARDYAVKAQSNSKLQGSYVSLACYYYYFAKYQFLVPEAGKELEQLLGQWASRAALGSEKKLLTKKTKLKKNEVKKLSELVATAFVGYNSKFYFVDINTSLTLVPDDLLYAIHVIYESGYGPGFFNLDFDFDFDEDDDDDFVSLRLVLENLRHCPNNGSHEETMCTLFTEFIECVEHEMDVVSEHIKDNLGMPSEAAFMIGMAYLEGNGIVQPNRSYAYAFLKYAMLTGSPRACLAWAVFGETFDTDRSDDNDTALLECYCNTLLHGFLLCRIDLNCKEDNMLVSLRKGQLCLYEDQERNDISLNIALSLTAALIRIYRLSSCTEALLNAFMSFIVTITELSINLERSYYGQMAIRCCLARMITIIGDNPTLKEEVGMIVDTFTKSQNNYTSKARMAFELIKPYINKKEAIVDQTLLDLDPISKDAQVQKAYIRLASQGSPEAFFKLASIGKMTPDNKLFKSGILNSAATGHPVACYNAYVFSSQQDNCDEDTKFHYLRQSILGSVPQAFISLFREYAEEKGIKREIADTCLRYATEYLYPKAKNTLNAKKLAGDYKPLPFIRVIEEIEDLAQSSSTAAIFLASLYLKGIILPQDPFKADSWYRKAVELGDPVSVEQLLHQYAEKGSSDIQYRLLGSMQHNLEIRDAYPVVDDLEEDQEENTAYVSKLYESLKKGKSWLEKHIFADVYDAELWQIMGIRTQAREKLSDEHKQAYAQKAMLDACRIYCEMEDVEPLLDDGKSSRDKTLLHDLKLVHYCSLHSDLQDYLCNYNDLRMFVSLRGKCSLDVKEAKKYIQDSYTANNFVATVLSRVNIEALSLKGTEAEIKVDSQNTSNKSGKKRIQQSKHVFDVTVEQ